MKKWIIFFFIMSILVSFSNNVILGIALSFKGVTSEFSEDQLRAIELANNDFSSYKNYIIKLSVNDISNNVEDATLNLISKGALALMGYPTSSQALKAVNITEIKKVPIILTTATNFLLTFGKNYVFMSTPSDQKEAQVISDFIVNNFKDPKIAFIYNTDQLYCSGIVSRIYSKLIDRLFIFRQKNYNLCNDSLECAKKLANSIKNYDPDIIFFSSYFRLSDKLLKILEKSNLKSTFLFSSSFDDKEFFDTFPIRTNVYVCSLSISGKEKKFYNEVAKRYEKKYSKFMDLYSFMAYNSYLTFYKALKLCVDSGKEINRYNINYYIQRIGKSENFKKTFNFKISKLSDLIISRQKNKEKK